MQSPTSENQVIKKDKNLRSLSSEGMHTFLTLASNFISLQEESFFCLWTVSSHSNISNHMGTNCSSSQTHIL